MSSAPTVNVIVPLAESVGDNCEPASPAREPSETLAEASKKCAGGDVPGGGGAAGGGRAEDERAGATVTVPPSVLSSPERVSVPVPALVNSSAAAVLERATERGRGVARADGECARRNKRGRW